MRQVSQEDFYKSIYDNNLDVHPRCIQTSPTIISEFVFHNKPDRSIYGNTVSRYENGRHVQDYFLV